MPSSARVLIVGNAPGSDHFLPETLRKHGFRSETVELSADLQARCADQRPDIVVLDLLTKRADDTIERFVAFARDLKSAANLSNIPLIALGNETSCAEAEVENIRSARVDEIFLGPFNEHQFCGRMNALLRLNTIHEELVRRLNTSAKYGVDAPVTAPPQRDVADACVLVVGAADCYPVIESTLSQHATLVGALTPETALDYLSRRKFDAVIVDLADDHRPYLELCRSIRRNSRLYNLPIVALASQQVLQDADVSACEAITDIAVKPIRARELESRIVSLISELRFRDSLRSIYMEARHMATSDGLTGLFSRGFLLEHLRSVMNDARSRGDRFSLAFLDIVNITRINEEFGYVVGDRIIRQVGEMMSYLVRGEDLTARYSGGRFCVILPDTALDAATIAVRRIGGVVRSTQLCVPETEKPIRADLIAGICEFGDDNDPQSIIDRARTNLR